MVSLVSMSRVAASRVPHQPRGGSLPDRALSWRSHASFRIAAAPTVFVLIFAIARVADQRGWIVATCLSRWLIDIPCPGCGITTSVAALFSGHLQVSLDASAAGPAVLAFFALQTILAAVAALRIVAEPTLLRISQLNSQALSTVLLLTWIL